MNNKENVIGNIKNALDNFIDSKRFVFQNIFSSDDQEQLVDSNVTCETFTDEDGTENIMANDAREDHNFELSSVFNEIKSFGSKMYSAAKSSVSDLKLFQEFAKAQQDFEISRSNDKFSRSTGISPWAGTDIEDILKEECLNLSKEKSNFTRNPPLGAHYKFDYDIFYPVAVACMQEDANLVRMRYELVPKIVKEEAFWKNYFYRVSLIFQANGLTLKPPGNNTSVHEKVSSDECVSKSVTIENETITETENSNNNVIENNKEEDCWEDDLIAELRGFDVIEQDYETENDVASEDILQDWDEN